MLLRLQGEVQERLQALGYSPQLEWRPPNIPTLSVDLMLQGYTDTNALRTVAVEIDGPSHFTLDGHRTAATRTRDALLRLHGIEVRDPLPWLARRSVGACRCAEL